MIIETAALCLAMNVFFESRGEFVPGQYAVALVTMNRAEQDKSKVCKVVFAPSQFSWTKDVKTTKAGYILPSYLVNITKAEPDAWRKAKIIANVALKGRIGDITKGAKFFHTTGVRPSWRLAMVRTKLLGAHQFYRSRA